MNVSGRMCLCISHMLLLCVCLWSACLSICSMRPIFPKFVTEGILLPPRALVAPVSLIQKHTPSHHYSGLLPTPRTAPPPFQILDLLTGFMAGSSQVCLR